MPYVSITNLLIKVWALHFQQFIFLIALFAGAFFSQGSWASAESPAIEVYSIGLLGGYAGDVAVPVRLRLTNESNVFQVSSVKVLVDGFELPSTFTVKNIPYAGKFIYLSIPFNVALPEGSHNLVFEVVTYSETSSSPSVSEIQTQINVDRSSPRVSLNLVVDVLEIDVQDASPVMVHLENLPLDQQITGSFVSVKERVQIYPGRFMYRVNLRNLGYSPENVLVRVTDSNERVSEVGVQTNAKELLQRKRRALNRSEQNLMISNSLQAATTRDCGCEKMKLKVVVPYSDAITHNMNADLIFEGFQNYFGTLKTKFESKAMENCDFLELDPQLLKLDASAFPKTFYVSQYSGVQLLDLVENETLAYLKQFGDKNTLYLIMLRNHSSINLALGGLAHVNSAVLSLSLSDGLGGTMGLSALDFIDTVVHEIGHILGLGHVPYTWMAAGLDDQDYIFSQWQKEAILAHACTRAPSGGLLGGRLNFVHTYGGWKNPHSNSEHDPGCGDYMLGLTSEGDIEECEANVHSGVHDWIGFSTPFDVPNSNKQSWVTYALNRSNSSPVPIEDARWDKAVDEPIEICNGAHVVRGIRFDRIPGSYGDCKVVPIPRTQLSCYPNYSQNGCPGPIKEIVEPFHSVKAEDWNNFQSEECHFWNCPNFGKITQLSGFADFFGELETLFYWLFTTQDFSVLQYILDVLQFDLVTGGGGGDPQTCGSLDTNMCQQGSCEHADHSCQLIKGKSATDPEYGFGFDVRDHCGCRKTPIICPFPPAPTSGDLISPAQMIFE